MIIEQEKIETTEEKLVCCCCEKEFSYSQVYRNEGINKERITFQQLYAKEYEIKFLCHNCYQNFTTDKEWRETEIIDEDLLKEIIDEDTLDKLIEESERDEKNKN